LLQLGDPEAGDQAWRTRKGRLDSAKGETE